MKSSTVSDQMLDASSFVGIVAGIGMLLPALLMPEMRFLALPAFLVLLPSLLYGMR